MSQSFLVTIPEGVKPGDTFQTLMMDKHMIPITCPDNALPGTILQVKVNSDAENNLLCIEETPVEDDNLQSWDYCTTTWVLIDMVLLILFTLSCTLPAFAIQQISAECLVTNPYTNIPVTRLYYSLYGGLGTNINCNKGNNEVCLSWSDNRAWSTFVDLVDNASSMQRYPLSARASPVSSEWTVAQVLIPFCIIFSLVAAGLHCSALFKKDRVKILYLTLAIAVMTFIWMLGVISIACVLNSPTTYSVNWRTFYADGYNLINLVTGNVTAGSMSPSLSLCDVRVNYTEGANILIAATVLAFISAVLMAFSVCFDVCYGMRTLYRGPAPKYITYRKPSVQASSSSPLAAMQQPTEEKADPEGVNNATSSAASNAPAASVGSPGMSEYVVAQSHAD